MKERKYFSQMPTPTVGTFAKPTNRVVDLILVIPTVSIEARAFLGLLFHRASDVYLIRFIKICCVRCGLSKKTERKRKHFILPLT